VPLSRQRWALSARAARRFSSSTLRLFERLYIDSWGIKASTTDAELLFDVTDTVRIWPHLRFHAQSGADFWKIAYAAQRDVASNTITIPALRAGDRELGPMLALTFGGGARFTFGEKKEYGLALKADVIYTRFLEHLYILQRFGYFGATSFEMEFE
jgi:hypothetical protein